MARFDREVIESPSCTVINYPTAEDLKPLMRKPIIVTHTFGVIHGPLRRWDRKTYQVSAGQYGEHAHIKFELWNTRELIISKTPDNPPILHITIDINR